MHNDTKEQFAKRMAWRIWGSAGLSLSHVHSKEYKALLNYCYTFSSSSKRLLLTTSWLTLVKKYHDLHHKIYSTTMQDLIDRGELIDVYTDASISPSNTKQFQNIAIVFVNKIGEHYIHRETTKTYKQKFKSRASQYNIVLNGIAQLELFASLHAYQMYALCPPHLRGVSYTDSVSSISILSKHAPTQRVEWIPRNKNKLADLYATYSWNVAYESLTGLSIPQWPCMRLIQRMFHQLNIINPKTVKRHLEKIQQQGFWHP